MQALVLFFLFQALGSYSRETPGARAGEKEKLKKKKKDHRQTEVECEMKSDSSAKVELLAGRRLDPS